MRIASGAYDNTARIWTLHTIPELMDLLWRSTPYCLPIDERISRLAETTEEATTRLAACQARVAEYAAQGAYGPSSTSR